jgi:ketosteroid isomerase-like protein
MNSNLSNLIRKYYSSYESKDRKSLEDLLSDDFTFSGPLDDHISRTTYFQRCWPNSETVSVFHIEKLFEKGNEAFVRYEMSADSRPRISQYRVLQNRGRQDQESGRKHAFVNCG